MPAPSDHTYRYLVKDAHALAQLLVCSVLNHGYLFYSCFYVPRDRDILTLDAKIILTYQTHLSKDQAYRRKKAGLATVKYYRLGRIGFLLATKGKSPFFAREGWNDIRERPLCFKGYSLAVSKDGDISCRLHREAFNRFKKAILKLSCKRGVGWWEHKFRTSPYVASEGIRDGMYALLKHLNQCRKMFRHAPVRWDDCNVRKKYKPQPAFLETPEEIKELLRWEAKAAKVARGKAVRSLA